MVCPLFENTVVVVLVHIVHVTFSVRSTQYAVTVTVTVPQGSVMTHAHPSRAIRAYTAPTNEDIFSTQYAVSSKLSKTQTMGRVI